MTGFTRENWPDQAWLSARTPNSEARPREPEWLLPGERRIPFERWRQTQGERLQAARARRLGLPYAVEAQADTNARAASGEREPEWMLAERLVLGESPPPATRRCMNHDDWLRLMRSTWQTGRVVLDEGGRYATDERGEWPRVSWEQNDRALRRAAGSTTEQGHDRRARFLAGLVSSRVMTCAEQERLTQLVYEIGHVPWAKTQYELRWAYHSGFIPGLSAAEFERLLVQPNAPRDEWSARIDEWFEGYCARIEQAVREQRGATERARAFLLSALNDEQRAQYEKSRFFDLTVPSGNRYRITYGRQQNVYLLDRHGNPCVRYCVTTDQTALTEDIMVMQMYLLRWDEAWFLQFGPGTYLRVLSQEEKMELGLLTDERVSASLGILPEAFFSTIAHEILHEQSP